MATDEVDTDTRCYLLVTIYNRRQAARAPPREGARTSVLGGYQSSR